MGAKILIVEDHPDSCEILALQLRQMGYDVVEAADAQEAIGIAAAQNPNLIIMDLGLPGMNGIEAMTRLRANPLTARIPVIAHTAWNEHDYKNKALQAGMAAYLTKPTPPQVLQQVLKKILQAKP